MNLGKSLPTLSALAALAFLAGCSATHTHVLTGFDADPAKLRNSRAKKVAVVFLEPDFKERYESSTEGHTFVFQDTKGFYKQAYGAALAGSVASVEYLTAEPAGGFNLYLYPKLDLVVKSKLITKYCLAEYALTAKDGAKKVIATKSKQAKHNFQIMSTVDESCKIAMLNSFDEVTYGVLKEADASYGVVR